MITNKLVIAGLFAAITLYGCKSEHKHNEHPSHSETELTNEHEEHEHESEEVMGHEHEHEPSQHTLLQNNYELFMEISPLIMGDAVNAIIHITRLSDYKPVSTPQISIELVGNTTFTYQADMETAGIFHGRFTPEKVGKYTLNIYFNDDQAKHAFTMHDIDIVTEENYTENHSERPSGLITYLKEQAWYENFGITEIKRTPFARIIKTSGVILPAPGDETIITAMHSGTISLKANLIEGKQVNKGEVISNISSDLIHQNLTNDYLQAKNQFEKAELDFKRGNELIKEKLISEKEFLEAKLNYESTKNTYNNIAKYYSDGNENVVSSNSGYIRSVFVQEGQFIHEGQPIATIIQNKRILLKADIPQQYNHLASGFYTANFSPVYSNKLFKISALNGQRTSYSSALPENSMFTSVHFEFDANPEIMPGSYAEVYLKSATVDDVLTVPISALMEDQGNYFVFVVYDGENYQKTYIKTGNSDGENIEVVSGLEEGDYVVSQGTYQVYLASLGNAAPAHSHAH